MAIFDSGIFDSGIYDVGAGSEFKDLTTAGGAGHHKVLYRPQPKPETEQDEIMEALREVATSTKTLKLRRAARKYPELNLVDFEPLLKPEIKIKPFVLPKKPRYDDDLEALIALGML